MPLFSALMSGLFTALATFLARMFAAKLPIRLMGVTALATLGGALLVLFNGYISPLVAMAFSTSYGQFIGLAFPPVAGTVLATYFTAFLAVITYKIQARAVALTASM